MTWLYGLTVGCRSGHRGDAQLLRAREYEYVQFQPVAGVTIDVNTVRLGGGIKF